MPEKDFYLGTALEYPIQVNQYGRVATVSGKEVIPASILNILQTPIGSRFMLPEFGSDVQELIFEPNDQVLRGLLIYRVTNALALWEKRIQVENVTVVIVSRELVDCMITYRILASNEIDSFVYPFYRKIIY